MEAVTILSGRSTRPAMKRPAAVVTMRANSEAEPIRAEATNSLVLLRLMAAAMAMPAITGAGWPRAIKAMGRRV